MAKRRIENYKFTPGIHYNLYHVHNHATNNGCDNPNAFIDFKIAQDTAADLYPNASNRITNNLE